MKKIFLSLIFLLLFAQNSWASHPTCYEIEPNNTPSEATPFSGSIILMVKYTDLPTVTPGTGWGIDQAIENYFNK